MPLDNRDSIKGSHPPYCTCTECVAKRLDKLKKDPSSLPPRYKFIRRDPQPKKGEPTMPKRRNKREGNPATKNLKEYILDILWKIDPVGKILFILKPLTKLVLNLLILTGLVLLIRGAYLLFTTHPEEPLRDSIILILGLALWIALIKFSRSKARHYWLRYKGTRPSFKLTTFLVISILLVFTFAGVQPMSTYKDNIANKWTTYWTEQKVETEERLAQAEIEKQQGIEEQKVEEQKKISEAIGMTPITITEALPKSQGSTKTLQDMDIRKAEELAFTLINEYRKSKGVPPTVWDDKLYDLSKAHTQEMASKGQLFHSSGGIVGENAWGGRGYYQYSSDDLAMAIASGWTTSPLHNAWLLHAPIEESVVSIVVTPDGQYASWSFWMNKLSSGPELVQKVAAEWRASGSGLDWIPWLKSKGYL
jgi:uncharacterized protein YkwD